MRKLRQWLTGTQRKLSRKDALMKARKYAEDQGWPWCEPVLVVEGIWTFRIMTNANFRGANVNIRLRASDGAITFAAYARR